MTKYEVELDDVEQVGYEVALATGEDDLATKAKKHYRELAPMATKLAAEAEMAAYLKVKDAPEVKAAVEAEVAKVEAEKVEADAKSGG